MKHTLRLTSKFKLRPLSSRTEPSRGLLGSPTLRPEIARLAEGDARMALHTLSNAARLAQNSGDNRIAEHIQEGFSNPQGLKNRYRLRALSQHHQLLYQIIKEKGEVTSSQLQQAYLSRCKERGLEPTADRTVDKYLRELILQRFIEKERAKRRGRVFNYRVVEQ